MTKVAILPESTDGGGISYRAIAGDRQSRGETAGQALDALTAQLLEDEVGTLIIVQSRQPDQFFTAEQQQRLSELMVRWRDSRDRGEALPTEEQAELDALAETELQASADRAAGLL